MHHSSHSVMAVQTGGEYSKHNSLSTHQEWYCMLRVHWLILLLHWTKSEPLTVVSTSVFFPHFHGCPSQLPLALVPPHLQLAVSPRVLEAILSFSIDPSHQIQYMLVLEFSTQKVTPIYQQVKYYQ